MTHDSTPSLRSLRQLSPVVIMGVSGSGKSTVGRILAEAVRGTFVDGDDLHPLCNLEKMKRGEPLTDRDRLPWLHTVGDLLADHDRPVVVGCSALKRKYRDLLRRRCEDIFFVCLEGSRDELRQRMTQRDGHFMPPSLLESQLRIFEPLDSNERGVRLSISLQLDKKIEVITKLWAGQAA